MQYNEKLHVLVRIINHKNNLKDMNFTKGQIGMINNMVNVELDNGLTVYDVNELEAIKQVLNMQNVTNHVKNGNSASAIRHDFVHRLEIAATIDSQAIHPHLSQLFGYRQKIAQDLLRAGTDDFRKSLEQMYDYVNSDIKKIIGL